MIWNPRVSVQGVTGFEKTGFGNGENEGWD